MTTMINVMEAIVEDLEGKAVALEEDGVMDQADS